MLTQELNRVLAGESLTDREMEAVIDKIASKQESEAQVGAFLAALRMKGETVQEVTGAARYLRRKGVFIDTGAAEVMDIVGTGGDQSYSFNISTTATFVAAGAGVIVAKHGNRSVSSKCGAADVLAELGFNLDTSPESMEESIRDNGVGFLFAQKMHPVLGGVAPIRRALGVRTVFNVLGPLTNPAGATTQLTGVYDTSITELLAGAMRELGVKRAMVVHSADGMDEISANTPTRVSELRDGAIRTYDLQPSLCLDDYEPGPIGGGAPAENAAITRGVLSGTDRGPNRAVVLINAGAAIYLYGLADSVRDGVRLAAESIDSGSAQKKLEALIRASQNG